jgi:pyruvate dehydrogenase E1 component beta subunit
MLAPVRRVCGRDNPMPYADNLEKATIPQVTDVVKGAAEVMED